MRPIARWALPSSAAAPVLLIGGWTIAARRQPADFDPVVDTISALAGEAAADPALMTVALLGVGACHLLTALGLRPAAPAGRWTLALGGVATLLVAAFPLPRTGSSTAHTVTATVAFAALALWPALAWRRTAETPALLRRAPSIAASGVLLGLVLWFGFCLSAEPGAAVGLAERVAAGAQALWPLLVVVTALAGQHRHRTRP